jgi:hypothetical protein
MSIGRSLITVLLNLIVACSVAGTGSASSRVVPLWLKAAEARTLHGFYGARLVHTDYVWYPRKVAVIWEFSGIEYCGSCTGSYGAKPPGGRAIRVSYDRATHRAWGEPREATIGFCDAPGLPPRSFCLRR